jgi:hypothetical protein
MPFQGLVVGKQNSDDKEKVQETDRDKYLGKVSMKDEVGSSNTWSLVLRKKGRNNTSHHNTKYSTSHHNTKSGTSHCSTETIINKDTFTKLTTL